METKFNIGARVRMLRSSEEGTIIKIKGNIIEFEDQDGFIIPVLASELVLVNTKEEEKYFDPKTLTEPKKEPNHHIQTQEPKFYLAFVPHPQNQYKLAFYNDSSQEVFYTIAGKDDKILAHSYANSRELSLSNFIFSAVNIENYRIWKVIIILTEGKFNDMRTFSIKLNLVKVFKDLRLINDGKTKVYLQQLLQEKTEVDVPKSLTKSDNFFEPYNFVQEKTIDLHANVLGIDHLAGSEILAEQLRLFNKEFDLAVANGLMELTVIHGVGNGVLRQHIHLFLSANKQIEWFKDVQKEKFGHGATLIHFRI